MKAKLLKWIRKKAEFRYDYVTEQWLMKEYQKNTYDISSGKLRNLLENRCMDILGTVPTYLLFNKNDGKKQQNQRVKMWNNSKIFN